MHLGQLTISVDDTLKFAELSGDFNPLHVDPIAARRLRFGHTVIHGVNGTVAALELLFAKLAVPAQLTSLSVNYSKPVTQGDVLTVVYHQDSPGKGKGKGKLDVFIGGKRAQVIKLQYDERLWAGDVEDFSDSNRKPIPLSISDAESLHDSFQLSWNQQIAKQLFPKLIQSLPAPQVAFLLGMTGIVGMRCPGLHSVFAGLKVSFAPYEVPDNSISYDVELVDLRFSRVVIQASSNVATAQIDALFREPVVQQPSYDFVRSCVEDEAFAQQNALIIGGSRGLGEIVGKAVAAGGGKVTITYATGEHDANKIKTEINASGGKANALKLNVVDLAAEAIEALKTEPFTHIYYFASPLIEKNDELFSSDLFNKFCQFYVTGMAQVVNTIAENKQRRKDAVTLFVPSTVFIDENKKGFAEYVTAKLAAETYAKQQVSLFPGWQCVMPRLKPMLTDQTASVVTTSAEDNVKDVVAILKTTLQFVPLRCDAISII